MARDSRKYLYDIRVAAEKVEAFTADCDFDSYAGNELVHSVVERQLEIIGEALAQLARHHPAVVMRISEYSRIIAFRNILIHGCAEVDARIVWDIVTTKLQILRVEIDRLANELQGAEPFR